MRYSEHSEHFENMVLFESIEFFRGFEYFRNFEYFYITDAAFKSQDRRLVL